MSGGESRGSPRWSVVTPETAMPVLDRHAAGEQGHGLGRSAVIRQRAEIHVGEAGEDDLPSEPSAIPPDPPVPIRLC